MLLYAYLRAIFTTPITQDTRRTGHFVSYLSGKRTLYGRIGVNQMAFDLGFPEHTVNDSREIINFIRKLDAELDLVLVAELMDESLILLKHALGWTLQDVIGFQQNARTSQFLPNRIPDSIRRTILGVNFIDAALYGFFRSKLNDSIYAYGVDKLKAEVAELRYRRMEVYGDCVENEEPAEKVYAPRHVYRNDVVGYRIKQRVLCSEQLCDLLVANELQLTEMIRRRQMIDISVFYFIKSRLVGSAMAVRFSKTLGLLPVALCCWVLARRL